MNHTARDIDLYIHVRVALIKILAPFELWFKLSILKVFERYSISIFSLNLAKMMASCDRSEKCKQR